MKLKHFLKNLFIILTLFVLFILFISVIIFTLVLFYEHLFQKSLTNTSSINQLLKINILNLFINVFIGGFLLLGFFILLNLLLNFILNIFNIELSKDFYIFEIKTYFILIVFTTMLFNFNSEQFNIIATILSMWAISSSSKLTKKIINKLVEIITGNN